MYVCINLYVYFEMDPIALNKILTLIQKSKPS